MLTLKFKSCRNFMWRQLMGAFYRVILITVIIVICHCTFPNCSALCAVPLTINPAKEKGTESPRPDSLCEELDACEDKLGLEAIRYLHRQLDDDANGNVDVAESDDFLRDELHYENGYERQKGFHGNDKHISVDELWKSWKASEVHNWTVEETVQWLVTYVDLPQYVQNFNENGVDGTALPRMAVNDANYLSSVLGIKDIIHRQKLALKAMDVVLFGPPKHHNYVKDTLLVLSLVVAVGGCWFAFVQHKYSKIHLRKMMNDMESLQKAEEALQRLQEELDKAREEQENVAIEKENLEKRLRDEINISRKQGYDGDNEDVSRMQQLEEELERVREELRRAEKAVETRAWVPPPALQHWLQLTHELELRHYSAKKIAAEQQLAAAKEGCEKLRKKRSNFMGTFRIAHGSSIDDVDNKILQAKSALSEVTQDLQERLHRWRQIELLCNFPIVYNPGLRHLQLLLQGASSSSLGQAYSTEGSLPRSGSEATLLEDSTPSVYSSGGLGGAVHYLVHSSVSTFLVPVPRFAVCGYGEHGVLDHSTGALNTQHSSPCLASQATKVQPTVMHRKGSISACPITAFPRLLLGPDGRKESIVTVPSSLAITAAASELSRSGPSSMSLKTESTSATNFPNTSFHQQDSSSEHEEDEKGYEEDVESLDGSIALSLAPCSMSVEGGNSQFVVEESQRDIQLFPLTPEIKMPRKMVKSFSQDTHFVSSQEAPCVLNRFALSETGINGRQHNTLPANFMPHHVNDGDNQGSLSRRKKSGALIKKVTSATILDEENSTDSNSTTEENERKGRRKKSFLTELIKKKSKAS